jgi:hypothetical protein
MLGREESKVRQKIVLFVSYFNILTKKQKFYSDAKTGLKKFQVITEARRLCD